MTHLFTVVFMKSIIWYELCNLRTSIHAINKCSKAQKKEHCLDRMTNFVTSSKINLSGSIPIYSFVLGFGANKHDF